MGALKILKKFGAEKEVGKDVKNQKRHLILINIRRLIRRIECNFIYCLTYLIRNVAVFLNFYYFTLLFYIMPCMPIYKE
jgi:hypothetical protein